MAAVRRAAVPTPRSSSFRYGPGWSGNVHRPTSSCAPIWPSASANAALATANRDRPGPEALRHGPLLLAAPRPRGLHQRVVQHRTVAWPARGPAGEVRVPARAEVAEPDVGAVEAPQLVAGDDGAGRGVVPGPAQRR